MSLPIPGRPEYSTTIPSTGKKVKYNPFSVREEKTLVLAAESENPEEISNAVVSTLQRCITSPSDLDVESLALFDIEYLFLKARSKSVGEKITVSITDPDDPTCKGDHDINIDKIGVKRTEGHKQIIELGDDIKVKMRYPGIEFFADGIDMTRITNTIDIMASCIDSIMSGDEDVYNREDMSDGELEDWVEGLTSSQFAKLVEFFTTMPKLSHTITAKNPKTGNEFTIVLEGLADFF